MDILNICRLGYFDNIKLNSIIHTSIGNGIAIKDEIFKNNINKDTLAKLRINIIGESFRDSEEIEEYRLNNGIKTIGTGKNKGYLIGYLDAYIVKGRYNQVLYNGILDTVDATDYTTKNNEIETIDAALNLQKYIESKTKLDRSEPVIAIINRLYVLNLFRENGISSWVHNNIFEILHQFSTMFISGVVLECGDFNKEARETFGMTEEEYIEFLMEHYMKCGYKRISDVKLISNGIHNPFILYNII